MHELSIARSLLSLVRENTPAHSRVRSALVRVGPLQAIEPGAMQLAWHAVSDDTSLDGVTLSLTFAPWQLRCRECGLQWNSNNWPDPCPCGSREVDPSGGDDLTLLSLDVEEYQPETSKESQPVIRDPA